jgi:hemerythrin-like domain-containing protein
MGGKKMETMQVTNDVTPCGSPLPELEVPMISTMVQCLGSEHRKLDDLIMQLALAATRLANDPKSINANQRAVDLWDEIRRDLWQHLQVEDGLIFSWGESHRAIAQAMLDALKIERQEMRRLLAVLPDSVPGADRERSADDRKTFALTLLALVKILDAHVERYDGEVLPSVLRALFKK